MVPKIAIIGGGPCGLTLARLMECNGIDYVVYERDESASVSRGGGSLDIHAGSGQRAIRESGLFDEFKKYARWDATTFLVWDKYGKKRLEIGQGRDAPEIDRVKLRRTFLDSIPKEKIQWNYNLTRMMLGDDGKPVLQFSNGSTLSGFKLVVGADGTWSKVRPLITQVTPKYSGWQFIESSIHSDSPIYEAVASKVGHGTFTGLGSLKQIVAQQQGDGSYKIYYGLSLPEDFVRSGVVDLADAEATRNLLLSPDYFADWADELKDFIRYSNKFRSWPLYYIPPEALSWKSVSGLTLVGDAAHVSTPFAGEGVNCAMTDALMLASEISAYGIDEGLGRAVREYEEDMFPRGIDVITKSSRNAELMFHEDSPTTFLQVLEDMFSN